MNRGFEYGLVALTVDITDPVVLSTIAQTAVLTLTLVIFIMSFRSQNNANKEAAYQRVLDDHTDAIRMLVDKPEFEQVSTRDGKGLRARFRRGALLGRSHDGLKRCHVAVRTLRENTSPLQKEVD